MEPKRNEDDSQRKFGYTQILWQIKNYLPATCRKTWVIHSPEFRVAGYHLIKWRISLKAVKADEDNNYVTSIYLERLESDPFPCAVRVQWNMWYACGNEPKTICVKECVFEKKGKIPVEIKHIKWLERWLQSTSFSDVFIGALILVRSVGDISIVKRAKDFGLKSLSQDLIVLYKLQHYRDLKINADGGSLMCHKAVLWARSEMLEDVIEKDEENDLLRLDWEDYQSAEKVFSYLYSGNLDYILRMPSILIDKYIQLLKIKKFRTCYLKDTITLRTKFDVKEINVKWLITDVKSINENSFTSSLFCKESLNFRLSLCVNGNGNNSDQMGIFLEFVDGMQPEEMYVKFDIIDILGLSVTKRTMRWSSEESEKLGIEDFVSRDVLNSSFYATKGSITVLCTLYIPMGSPSLSVVSSRTCSPNNITYEDHYALLSTHIESLLLTGKYSDLILICKEEMFNVHKCILSARSLSFRKSIKALGESDIFLVSEINPNILRIILGYIYSGKLKDYELCDVFQIYAAAVKFFILALKYECSRILQDNLQLLNVIEALCLANTFKDFRLKTSAFKFITNNITGVKTQDKWEQLKTENRSLYEELKEYVKNYLKSNPEESFRLVDCESEWFCSLRDLDGSMEY